MSEIKLGSVLKRELEGENVNRFARSLGIPPSLLHSWLAEKRLPNAKNFGLLKKVADRLGLTLEQLIFDGTDTDTQCLARTSFTDNGASYEVRITKRKESK